MTEDTVAELEPVQPETVVDGIDPEGDAPAEVIRVDELLERLLEEGVLADQPVEETTEPVDTPPPEPLEVAGTDETLRLLESIQEDVEPHPFLTTDFEDYTVAEGLLLLVLLLAFFSFCIKLLKEGFSWL